MIAFTKTLASCAAAIVLIGSASAQSSFSVDFKYNPTTSAERNYDGFKKSAKKACRAEYRRTRSLSMRHHLVKACQLQVLDLVVERVGSSEIAALHRPDALPAQRRVFAQSE